MKQRNTVAQHAKLKQQSLGAQVFALLATALVTVLVAGIAVAGFYGFSVWSNFSNNSVAIPDAPAHAPQMAEYPGAYSVLVVGTDTCDTSNAELVAIVGEERCFDPDANNDLNDVNILVHVSAAPRKLTAVVIPRDTVIDVPECTREDGSIRPASYQPINEIYPDGGLGCVAAAVSELSGLEIPFALKVSFADVVAIADVVGTVEVCVAGDGIYDAHTGLNLSPGMHALTPGQALQFMRTRHGVGDGSDLARGGNQRQYLARLLEKLASADTLSDPGKLLQLANALSTHVTPSESLADPIRIVELGLSLRGLNMADATFLGLPVGNGDGGKVVPIYEDAQIMWDAIAAGQSLAVTGDVALNEGAVEAAPDGTVPTPDPEDETVEPTEPVETVTPTPPAGTVELPSTITGNSAANNTCANGNG